MKTKLVRLSMLAAAFAFVFAFGSHAQAAQMRADRGIGTYYKYDANLFGDDRATNTVPGAFNSDADSSRDRFTPETYGLMGDFWRNSGE